MNDRQAKLVETIKNNPNLTRRELQMKLLDYYPIHDNNQYYDTSLHLLTKDIQDINIGDNPYIILSDSAKGLWLGSKEDTLQSLKAEKAAILSRLKRLYKKARKVGLDGAADIDGFIHRLNEDLKTIEEE